jgi:hypothetical protein
MGPHPQDVLDVHLAEDPVNAPPRPDEVAGARVGGRRTGCYMRKPRAQRGIDSLVRQRFSSVTPLRLLATSSQEEPATAMALVDHIPDQPGHRKEQSGQQGETAALPATHRPGRRKRARHEPCGHENGQHNPGGDSTHARSLTAFRGPCKQGPRASRRINRRSIDGWARSGTRMAADRTQERSDRRATQARQAPAVVPRS